MNFALDSRVPDQLGRDVR